MAENSKRYRYKDVYLSLHSSGRKKTEKNVEERSGQNVKEVVEIFFFLKVGGKKVVSK